MKKDKEGVGELSIGIICNLFDKANEKELLSLRNSLNIRLSNIVIK